MKHISQNVGIRFGEYLRLCINYSFLVDIQCHIKLLSIASIELCVEDRLISFILVLHVVCRVFFTILTSIANEYYGEMDLYGTNCKGSHPNKEYKICLFLFSLNVKYLSFFPERTPRILNYVELMQIQASRYFEMGP